MNDPIDRYAALEAIINCTDIFVNNLPTMIDKVDAQEALEALPSAQPKRERGKWVWSDEDWSWKCSSCGRIFEEIEWKPEYNYCPNCGADMRGEKE